MTGGRPRRPAAEVRLVQAAAADFDPATPRASIARDLAARVVGYLRGFAAEGGNPALAAVGDLGRAVIRSPAVLIASCPDIDAHGLFVDERVASLRRRDGASLPPDQERADVDACYATVQAKLSSRYLKILRT